VNIDIRKCDAYTSSGEKDGVLTQECLVIFRLSQRGKMCTKKQHYSFLPKPRVVSKHKNGHHYHHIQDDVSSNERFSFYGADSRGKTEMYTRKSIGNTEPKMHSH
jgi:hypothetical protein